MPMNKAFLNILMEEENRVYFGIGSALISSYDDQDYKHG